MAAHLLITHFLKSAAGRGPKSVVRRLDPFLAVLVFALASVSAATEIHRCTLEDGTVAFQEMPCAEPAVSSGESSEAAASGSEHESRDDVDDVFDFVNPFDEPAGTPVPSEAALPAPPSQDRAECEKTTRDAIDAIDLEMRQNSYTQEEGQEYLQELLALTRQLRSCKQL